MQSRRVPSSSCPAPTMRRPETAPSAASAGDRRRRRAQRHPVRSRTTCGSIRIRSAWTSRASGSSGCASAYERDGFALLAVEDRETGEFLGNVGPILQHVDGVDEVELGWSITPAARPAGDRHGGRARMSRLGLRGAPVDHLISLILPANTPSRGVAEHLGMTVWKDVMWGVRSRSCTSSTGWTGPRTPRQS